MMGTINDLLKLISGDASSPAGKLTKEDFQSIGMGVFDSCMGVLLTAVQTQIVPALPPIPAMAINFAISKFLRKWISNGGIPEADKKK